MDKFGELYLDKFWKFQQCQWDNYVNGAKHNLTELDADIFKIIEAVKDKIEASGKEREVINSVIVRDLVDRYPEVSTLRNRLDNWDNYSQGITADQKNDQNQYHFILATRMRDDVIQLMRVRDYLAKNLGFKSYVDLVFFTEGIDVKGVTKLLEDYLEVNLPVAKEIIAKYKITWPTWFNDLNRIGAVNKNIPPNAVVENLLEKTGYRNLKDNIKIIFKDQGIAGYTGILYVPDNIRILVKPVDSLKKLITLFHETGHAVTHALNAEYGIFRTWSTMYDEAMASVIEQIGVTIFLDQNNKLAAQELNILENSRCAISSLFELSLWDHLDNAENLYTQLYSRLGLEIFNPMLWAVDCFRSVDPLYIQNYVIGDFAAKKIISYLQTNHPGDYESWGYWLNSNYFADGRKRSLKEKMSVLGDFVL